MKANNEYMIVKRRKSICMGTFFLFFLIFILYAASSLAFVLQYTKKKVIH